MAIPIPQPPAPVPTDYQPRNFVISNIESGQTTSVFTSLSNDYVMGQLVRFHIPSSYGMRQLNDQLSYVIAINSSLNFVIDVDSRTFQAFIQIPTYPGNTPPQVSAVGDNNTSTTGLSITGSFINIS
jgi:hypothetical protein